MSSDLNQATGSQPWLHIRITSIAFKNPNTRGAWVIRCLPSAWVMISGFWDQTPRRAPRWGPYAGSLLLPLVLPLLVFPLSLSLSLCQVNKILKKKERWEKLRTCETPTFERWVGKCLHQARCCARLNRASALSKNLKITSLWFNLTIFNYKGNVSN